MLGRHSTKAIVAHGQSIKSRGLGRTGMGFPTGPQVSSGKAPRVVIGCHTCNIVAFGIRNLGHCFRRSGIGGESFVDRIDALELALCGM